VSSTIKVDRIQSDTGTVNLASNLAFSSAFSMSGPVTLNSPTIATPTMTGQAVIPSINLTSGQIVFPATQNPSGNANTLDDYEEGNWTPTLTPASGSLTSFVSSGVYTKIGNVVTVQFRAQITNAGTASGVMSFGGLPFTSKSVGGRASISLVREDGSTGTTFQALIISAATTGVIATLTNGFADWVNGYNYTFFATYLTT